MTDPDQQLEEALKSAKRPEDRTAALQRFYESCESFLEPYNAPLACRKGCSLCCHIRVTARPHEIFAIVDYVEKHFSESERTALVKRLREARAIGKPLSKEERLGTNIACPMLKEGSCSIHPARPFVCRRYHSLDVKSCEYSYENPTDLKAGKPRNPVLEKRWQGMAEMGTRAFQGTGHQVEPVELVQGLLNAFENPKCRKRWVKGNSPLLGQ